MDTHLFSEGDVFALREHQTQALSTAIAELDSQRVLQTSVDDLCHYFVERFRIEVPTLLRDQAVADQNEVEIDISHDSSRVVFDRSVPHYVKGTQVSLEVPFSGEAELFSIQPSRFTLSGQRAVVHSDRLVLAVTGLDLNATRVQHTLNSALKEIEQHLATLRSDLSPFNDGLAGTVRARLEQRRNKLLADKNLAASIGFPLKERADSERTFPAPGVRRKVAPRLPEPSTSQFVPEPTLEDDHYQHILTVMDNMSVVMERSPSTFSEMGEEALRDHFLVQLNGHFEGSATGETFNASGKTDILIREDGKNVFIGECKFWRGPKAHAATIDQILSYTSWRDTKVALLIFNRNKDFSKVLEAIKSETSDHGNCKRLVREFSPTRTEYLFRHKDDVNRELTLTVMVFEIPGG